MTAKFFFWFDAMVSHRECVSKIQTLNLADSRIKVEQAKI